MASSRPLDCETRRCSPSMARPARPGPAHDMGIVERLTLPGIRWSPSLPVAGDGTPELRPRSLAQPRTSWPIRSAAARQSREVHVRRTPVRLTPCLARSELSRPASPKSAKSAPPTASKRRAKRPRHSPRSLQLSPPRTPKRAKRRSARSPRPIAPTASGSSIEAKSSGNLTSFLRSRWSEPETHRRGDSNPQGPAPRTPRRRKDTALDQSSQMSTTHR